MALLVQRVSGSYYDHYYMPNAAGVGFSYSTYKFMEEMYASKGMLRLVMGLGTKAVDRTVGDYPRLVSLDMPTTVLNSNSAYRHRYSQHKMDVIDLDANENKEFSFEDLLPIMPEYMVKIYSVMIMMQRICSGTGDSLEIFITYPVTDLQKTKNSQR